MCLHEHLAYNIRRDGNNWVITMGPVSFVFKKKKKKVCAVLLLNAKWYKCHGEDNVTPN